MSTMKAGILFGTLELKYWFGTLRGNLCGDLF